LRLIEQLCPDKTTAIVDIGGGESTLVDDLLQRDYLDVSVLDISGTAIGFTKQRLGAKAQQVSWHVGDIIQHDFGSKRFDLWHDRAVFHFMNDPVARHRYVDSVRQAVKPGGYVLMATKIFEFGQLRPEFAVPVLAEFVRIRPIKFPQCPWPRP